VHAGDAPIASESNATRRSKEPTVNEEMIRDAFVMRVTQGATILHALVTERHTSESKRNLFGSARASATIDSHIAFALRSAHWTKTNGVARASRRLFTATPSFVRMRKA
jgi:hypothetical protein